ncbi:universal stress protein [Euhalothece natronophila Z-M001]|uniref:Universal stress protein n=1 Tax=Euhalothece natronophila Z-M001 TaxID=522448 RepID=A0A5B8NKK8_9CHRO|nr:universal stress protein [Euhalothece natronophila]QDZ39782.1 universal stress protein [Euhalothece natronophila Z-M001]
MFKTILFPIDRSRETQEAVGTVTNLVKNFNSQLVLLSVVEPQSEEKPDPRKMTSQESVNELLEQVKSLFTEQSISPETLEREGRPAFIICDVADEMNADLIVMGCRGVGLIEEEADESVSNRVINLSPCPVLVIP